MNRTRRKAIKMFKKKYGKATNPYWTNHWTASTTPAYDALTAEALAMWQRVWLDCARGGSTFESNP